MDTATILLDLGLAVSTSAIVAAAMALVPNLDRIHLHRRRRVVARETRARLELQPR